jgi:hypothetical protein
MNGSLRAKLFASAMALSAVPLAWSTVPAFAQQEVSFDAFHDALAPDGDWVYSDRWGEVWVPENVPDDFHPYYTAGRWIDTDEYGWLWQSDYDWGDITFHYGRWVNDPDDGWLWIPGYVWSPGWVIWRSNDRDTGWMPMPPDDAFLRDSGGYGSGSAIGVSIDFNRTDDFYGYSRWYGRDYDESRFALNWVFIGTGNLSDRDYRGHTIDRSHLVNAIHTSRNVTDYAVVNHFIVNRSVDAKVVEHAGGHPVRPVQAATILKHPGFVTRVDTGRAVQVQMRQVQPRGTGVAHSAPQPSQAIVRTLSTRPVQRNGRAPTHLFTQQTVIRAKLAPATNVVAPPSTPSRGTGSLPVLPVAPVHGRAISPAPAGGPTTTPSGAPPTGQSTVPPGTRTMTPSGAPPTGGQSTPLPGTRTTTPSGTPPAGQSTVAPGTRMRVEHPNPTLIVPGTTTTPDHHPNRGNQSPAGAGGGVSNGPASSGLPETPPVVPHRGGTAPANLAPTGAAPQPGSNGPGATDGTVHHRVDHQVTPSQVVTPGTGAASGGSTSPTIVPPARDHHGGTATPAPVGSAQPSGGASAIRHTPTPPKPNVVTPATPSDHPAKPVKPDKKDESAPQ